MKRRIISAAMAILLSASTIITSLPITSLAAPNAGRSNTEAAGEEAISLLTERKYAREVFQNGENEQAMAFDLDLGTHVFDGTADGILDYGREGSPYLRALENFRGSGKSGSIIYRFKTETDGVIFGAGSSDSSDGSNMVFGLSSSGAVRAVLRNPGKNANPPDPDGLKGNFNSGDLRNGQWHTVAMSFLSGDPQKTYLVVDGGNNIYVTTWDGVWFPGFDKDVPNVDSQYRNLVVGGGIYANGSVDAGVGGNFNGSIDSITITDKSYTVDELKEITKTQCTCTVKDISFEGANIHIPENEDHASIELTASAVLGGSCVMDGHADQELPITYSLSEDSVSIANIEGSTLTVSGEGAIEVTAKAEINETAAEKTAVFVAANEEPAPVCTCEVSKPEFSGEIAAIPADAGTVEIALAATAALNGDCSLDGHADGTVSYTYEIVEDRSNIGELSEDHAKLIASGKGTVKVSVVASVNGKQSAATVATFHIIEEGELSLLEEVRLAARKDFADGTNESAVSLDLNLSDAAFDGTADTVLDFGTEDSPYLRALENLRKSEKAGSIIFKFKTSKKGTVLGVGNSFMDDQTSMIFGTNEGGALRGYFRNDFNNKLKGNFGSNLKDSSWHIAAMSFQPGEIPRVNLVIDGSGNLYNSDWINWNAGFAQNNTEITRFQIGGVSPAANAITGEMGYFDGAIDFVTITDRSFTLEELQRMTEEPDPNSFRVMTKAGTANTWLMTGSDTTVAKFDQLGAVKNYVGFFEENLRAGGTYVERGRFVHNTAQPGLTIGDMDAQYQTLIAQFGPKAVGIMVDRSDYGKGAEGIEAFKVSLGSLLDQIYADSRIPFMITPPPSAEETDTEKIAAYIEAMNEVAEARGTKIVNISTIATTFLDRNNRLTALGHQQVANRIKAEVGAGSATNFSGFNLRAEPTLIKVEEAPAVAAGVDQITVTAPGSFETDVKWGYELFYDGQAVTKAGLSSPFTITGLKAGKEYTLRLTTEGTELLQQLKDVTVTIEPDEEGVAADHPDGNDKMLPEFQALLEQEEPATYLFMGDSITHGIVTQGYNSVPELFEKYLEEQGRDKDVVINTGVSNATLSTTLNQIDLRLNKFNPDAVFVMLGTNDSSTGGEVVGSRTAITVAQYKESYKALVRAIYDNNNDCYAVLRVPCDMTVDAAHSNYKEFFASIHEVAEEMKEEIPELKIAVIDHMQDWIDYGNTVRNDFMSTSSPNTWMADSVHPNGRGNMRMFQQIIKETGLFKNDSELSNYQFELSDWADHSAMKADVICSGITATFAMEQLEGYANGLTEVTVKLTDENRVSISGTAEFDAEGTLVLKALKGFKPYLAEVTGKDEINNKEIYFAATINGMETGMDYTQIPQNTLTGSAGSAQPGEGPERALDGNNNTIWHSNYSDDAQKPVINPSEGIYERNEYTITLSEEKEICKLEYQPRTSGINGRIVEYQLYYSTTVDGDDFQEIPGGHGKWAGDNTLKKAEFDPVTARRIELRAMGTTGSTDNLFIAAAEFNLFTGIKRKPEIPNCNCVIENLSFEGQSAVLQENENNKEFLLNASATCNTECEENGHAGQEIQFAYALPEGGSTIASIIDGNKLVFTGRGSVVVTVTASVNGVTAQRSATFTVEGLAECSCEITGLAFAGSSIEIPADAESKEVTLSATATLGGDCQLADHQGTTVTYTFEKAVDQDFVGSVTGNKLTVTKAGTLEVKVTASANGKSVEKTATFFVTKVSPQECTCVLNVTRFNNANIEIPQNEASKKVTLSATAVLTGDCSLHPGKAITYEYAITDDKANIGSIKGRELTVTNAGTIEVKVTAKANEKTAEKTATFTVTKEAEEKYTATFNGGNGAQGTAPALITAEEGSRIKLPQNTFIKAGYDFAGWSDGTKVWAEGADYTMPGDDITFTAVWINSPAATYSLTFHANGGKVSVASKTVTVGQKYGTLPVPERAGYQFIGWFTAATNGTQVKADDICNLNSDTIIYAQWKQEAQPPVVKPGKATNLKASANKLKSIKISWKKAANAKEYVLSRYDSTTKKWKDVEKTSATSYTDKGLKPGTVYKYRVKAYNKQGTVTVAGDFSAKLSAATKPLKISLKAKKSANSKVKLTWKKNTKVDGYEILMKAGKGKFNKPILRGKKASSYTTKKLQSGKPYTFKIRSYKKAGGKKVYSAYSKPVTIK